MSKVTRIFPQRGRQLFDGGKNSKFERAIIEDNESPDCLNVVFENGAVGTREGTVKLNTAAVGSMAFDGLYTRRADDGSETMVAYAGGTMYALQGTSFITIPSAQSVFTAGVRMAATQYENYLFMGNGGTIPYKWNGSTFTRHGVYAPTATAAVASNGTGNLTPSSDYRYKVTYVNSNLVESDVGPVTATFTISATSGQNRLSSLPIAPASYGVNHRYIYRTSANGSTFKRVGTIADNTTTTFDDNVADSSLGATAPTDNGVPPVYSICIYHQNRLWVNDAANPNYLWYSNLGDPYTFASTNFLKVGDNASDLLKALAVQDNAVVARCENSDTLIIMPTTDPSDWRAVVSKSPFGSKSPFCQLRYNNKNLFPAVQNGKFVGFAATVGETVDPSLSRLTVSTAGSLLKSDRIEPDMFNVQESYLGNISGIVFKNKAWITLTYGSGATTNNRIYQMDFSISNLSKDQKEAWVPFTGLNAAQFTIYNGRLYYASSDTSGFVFQCEAGVYSDNGAAINSYFWTKEFTGVPGEENNSKDFRAADLLVENAGAYFMDLAYRTNSDKGTGNAQQINLDPGSSLWGTMVFGRDTWGGGSDQSEVRAFLGGARGTRIQFKFSNQNTAGQRFKVHGLKFSYNPKSAR